MAALPWSIIRSSTGKYIFLCNCKKTALSLLLRYGCEDLWREYTHTSTANEFLHSELSISCNIVSDKTLLFHCANETALRTASPRYSTYCLVYPTACAQLLCSKAIQIILQNLAEHVVTPELHDIVLNMLWCVPSQPCSLRYRQWNVTERPDFQE